MVASNVKLLDPPMTWIPATPLSKSCTTHTNTKKECVRSQTRHTTCKRPSHHLARVKTLTSTGQRSTVVVLFRKRTTKASKRDLARVSVLACRHTNELSQAQNTRLNTCLRVGYSYSSNTYGVSTNPDVFRIIHHKPGTSALADIPRKVLAERITTKARQRRNHSHELASWPQE